MFDEEAERSKLSALDLTDDVIEMILKKKRSKYEERCPPIPVPNPQPPTPSPPPPVPDPQPPTPIQSVPELREEEEPEQFRLQSKLGGQAASISGNSLGRAPIKRHFHLWHRKLY